MGHIHDARVRFSPRPLDVLHKGSALARRARSRGSIPRTSIRANAQEPRRIDVEKTEMEDILLLCPLEESLLVFDIPHATSMLSGGLEDQQ